MLINKTYFIDSCDDFELGIKRTSKLEYRMSFDDEKEMKAIVFIIPGYGANANIHFLDSYRKFIAKKFDVIAINVFYHCFCQRRSDVDRYSATTLFLDEDLPNLKQILEDFNINTDNLNIYTANEYYYNLLNETITNLKEQCLLDENYKACFTSTFVPPNDEYQNFGIMAAIDHINALKDIFKNYPKFKSLPKIYGGSYGGYISCLIAKIAPWYVDGVIDNSGSALPPLNYVIGRDFGIGNSANFDHNIFL